MGLWGDDLDGKLCSDRGHPSTASYTSTQPGSSWDTPDIPEAVQQGIEL